MKPVTQKTVAEHLGLHTTTVSMALRGVQTVAPATRRRVLQAATKMGYRPNALARGLRYQGSRFIGVIATSPRWDVSVQRMNAMSRKAHERDYELVSYSGLQDEGSYERAVSFFLSYRAAGLIVAAGHVGRMPTPLRTWLDQGGPTVFFSAAGDNAGNVIDTDRAAGYRQAVRYLAELGHRRIALSLKATGTLMAHVDDRAAGYRQGLDDAGLAFRDEWVLRYQTEDETEVADAMKRLVAIEPRPTAMIGFADVNALLCIRHLMRLGLRVPQDVSVLGFDNDRACDTNTVTLTTLAQPVERMSELTMARIEGMIQGKVPRTFDPILVPPELIVRESTGPPCTEQ